MSNCGTISVPFLVGTWGRGTESTEISLYGACDVEEGLGPATAASKTTCTGAWYVQMGLFWGSKGGPGGDLVGSDAYLS